MKKKAPWGIGIDIVEIKRIQSLARRNARFLSRVFTEEEVRYCKSKRKKWQHLAVRFAAKEAVWKALGRYAPSLRKISIRNDAQGKPIVTLRRAPGTRRGLRGARRAGTLRQSLSPQVWISLSHSNHYAAAVALAAGYEK
ncbi:MAG: holo-ACP synthase [Elusimicrobia bacterium]|nr:holo-ACP synthase [Elusimicrobiota bacterium]